MLKQQLFVLSLMLKACIDDFFGLVNISTNIQNWGANEESKAFCRGAAAPL